jgi:predicted PurR-regulated permease PerM
MSDTEKTHPLSRFILIAAAVVIIVWSLVQAQSVVVSFLVSLFLAVLATPPVLWLERKKLPVALAVSLVVVGLILFLLLIGAVVGTSINSFYDALPQYQARIGERVDAFRNFLASRRIAPPEKLLGKYLNPQEVMTLTAGLFMRLGAAFSNIVLIVLTVIFILLEAASFPVKLRAVLGDPMQVFPRFTRFVDDIKRYIVLKTLISLATGGLVTIWLTINQVDFPVIWGFLAFLLNYVPSIGSTLASVPAILLTIVQIGVGRALVVTAGYVVINFALDYGIEKRLMGRKLGLSTLVVFLSLIVWASLLGPVGAVLCIPLTMTLKFAFESHPGTLWIAVLLGPEVPKDTVSPQLDLISRGKPILKPSAG